MTEKRAQRQVSLDQVKAILDFMGQHVEFATGSNRSLEARQASKQLWTDLTRDLNSRSGARKTADGWSRYWSDFKNKLKNKVNMFKKARRLGVPCNKSLTKLEKRALVILGPHFERIGLMNTKDLCNKPLSDQVPTIIKMEVSQESPIVPFINNDWTNENIGNDKIPEADNASNASAVSNEEFVEDSDGNVEEPVIHGIYPKWLVAIEKKRAEADYIRAKAEEHRANASEKNAQAALIQAEALKKLAEAAQTQAEAIMKIAVALENRNNMKDSILDL